MADKTRGAAGRANAWHDRSFPGGSAVRWQYAVIVFGMTYMGAWLAFMVWLALLPCGGGR